MNIVEAILNGAPPCDANAHLNSGTATGIVWDGDTQMNFFITDYNDPNVLYQIISVKIKDLIGKSKTFKNIDCNILIISQKYSL